MIPRLYLDANVIIDYLQQRPNEQSVKRILLLADNNKMRLYTSVLNFATIYYLERRRGYTTKQILDRFRLMNRVIEPIDQTSKSYHNALDSRFSDFEDGLQYYAALENGMDYIITGNRKHFRQSSIEVLTVREFIRKMND